MADPTKIDTTLSGWKSIAAHLGVSVRTAQGLEKERNLPIRRGIGSKAPVYAMALELDLWKEQFLYPAKGDIAELDGSPESPAAPPVSASLSNLRTSSQPLYARKAVWAVLAILLLASAGFVWSHRTGPPSQFRLEQNRLYITDEAGRELWRHSFPKFFMADSFQPEVQPTLIWIGKLSRDGETVVLFNYRPLDAAENGTRLFCFSSRGQQLWEYKPGEAVSTGEASYGPTYVTSAFTVLPDGRIAVASHHFLWYPSQLTLLDPHGNIQGQYWHSGFLSHIAVKDVDGDGRPELILGGINNGYHAVTMIVVSPDRLAGASSQPPGDITQIQGMKPAQELVRIIIPRSCIPRAINLPYGQVAKLVLSPDGEELYVEEPGEYAMAMIHYRFDARFRLVDVRPSDTFRAVHQKLELAGFLHHSFAEAEVDELRKNVQTLKNAYR